MPSRQSWETIKKFLATAIDFLRQHNPLTLQNLSAALTFMRKSWRSIAILLPVFLLVYYVAGSWATHNIDKSVISGITRPDKGLATAETIQNLLRREVDDNMWTPNLPIIFPGYILDNMPQYQSGILKSLKTVVETLSRHYDSENLNKAAKLLNYPTNIWLLSKTENLALAPSSGAQYRKAYKLLNRFNNEPLLQKNDSNDVLIDTLHTILNNTNHILAELETQIREYSSNWTDNQADNVFYYNQGRIYGYYAIMKALSEDFKQQILDNGQYEAWTSVNKTLEDAFLLDPLIVRNGELSGSFSPNHLAILGYYTAKARTQLYQIMTALKKTH